MAREGPGQICNVGSPINPIGNTYRKQSPATLSKKELEWVGDVQLIHSDNVNFI
jgi:hypothetical protein